MVRQRWRSIPGYEGHYEVSNDGQVRSLERKVISHDDGRIRVFKSRVLRPEVRHGYNVVNLSINGVTAKFYVHRLVLVAFRGEPKSGAEACHWNGIRDDNRLHNLRWDTHLSNVRDNVISGTHRSIGAYNANKTHCKRGHPFDKANTIVRPTGRGCRECKRITERVRYHKKKDQ
jgi:hypothetical protein